jgi:hypothetical protein
MNGWSINDGMGLFYNRGRVFHLGKPLADYKTGAF